MTNDNSSLAVRRSTLGHEPRAFFVTFWIVGLPTTAWAAFELRRLLSARPYDYLVAVMLVVVAIVFEEGATRIARLQWRLSSELKRDMASVWSISAAVALPRAVIIPFIVFTLIYAWWRQQRPAGQPLHRTLFTTCSVVAGCLAANYAFHAVEDALPTGFRGLATSIAVATAILVFTVTNRALVTLALLTLGARGRGLTGSGENNLMEFSTLCLGGLVAVAALFDPWLCVLAVIPMAMLQRGSFVRELETAAITDSKTGLLNAIGWEQLAKREVARAKRDLYPVSVLIVDIDHFKRVNDRHGHLVGDQVLKGLATALHNALREYDTLGRFGGEEFVAILPETGEFTAAEIAERVRSRVNSITIGSVSSTDDPDLLSVSIGIASTAVEDLPGTELSEMLTAADRALYRAKDSGRNRAFLADANGLDRDGALAVAEILADADRLPELAHVPPDDQPDAEEMRD